MFYNGNIAALQDRRTIVARMKPLTIQPLSSVVYSINASGINPSS